MRHLLITSILTLMTTINSTNLRAQAIDPLALKTYERRLDDVMELIDTSEVKAKLKEVEEEYSRNSSEMNALRLGIIYHETALNLSFLSKTNYKGYAKKSFDVLSNLYLNKNTTPAILPFVASYRASALSLVGAETSKLGLLSEAFALFEKAVNDYAQISYLPEFLRGSVAENLPWLFFKKRKFAKLDFQSIISKQEKNEQFANSKIMSFTYWAWAKQHQGKADRTKAITYLEKAIALDPEYKAGRKRAEELKAKLQH